MNPHLLVLTAYSAGLIVFGLWIGRRVKSSGDFFVAGRRLGPVLLFATVLAANIGAGSTVGAAGLGYSNGLSGWWWVGSAAIGTLLLALWIGPRIRRLAAERGFYTVGDFLEFRYGPKTRATVTGLLWVGTLAILAGQLIALAKVLEAVVGVPRAFGALMGGVVMTTYFAAGGLVGAAWINLVQLVVLLLAFVITVPLALAGVGGWQGVVAAAPTVSHTFAHFWSGGSSGWILLPILAPAFMVSPGLLQKVYGARDDRAVRVGVGLSAVVLLAFAFAPVVLGMVARIQYPGLSDPELALPMFLTQGVPVIIGAIGLGALFMADVSSADAILFMLATSLSEDFYKRFLNPTAGDRQVLSVARAAALCGGGAAVLLAIVSPSVVDALKFFYTLVGVTLFVPVVAGLYTGRAGAPEALAGVGAGIGVTGLLQLTAGPSGIGPITPSMAGLIVSAAAFVAVLVVRRRHRSAVYGGQ